MKALILNSGMGTRLGELTRNKPKGMLDIGGGYTLLSRQLELLSHLGISQAIITTGPFAPLLESHVQALGLPMDIAFVHNPDYARTNYIQSIHLTAPLLRGQGALLLHGDLVLEESVLRDLIQSPVSAMAVDSGLPLPEKDFKARLRESRIVAVGVELFGPDCQACQPAYHLLSQDLALWLDSIAAFVQQGEVGVYAENAFNALDGALPLYPLELGGRLCAEIDDPRDLEKVGRQFLETLA
ncbi:MAG: NTP transferase domain-containing protein [Candidatus Limiplasma sp.]|nr:NTP transferase domain-containing protein [Candidatus Limiplasma sp.]